MERLGDWKTERKKERNKAKSDPSSLKISKEEFMLLTFRSFLQRDALLKIRKVSKSLLTFRIFIYEKKEESFGREKLDKTPGKSGFALKSYAGTNIFNINFLPIFKKLPIK